MRGDLTDDDIEARLRAAPPEAWAALWSAVDELAAEDGGEHTRWGGGEAIGTTVVDGVEQPVIQMPYAINSEATERVVQALYGLGAIVPFDWQSWDGLRTWRGPTAFDDAPVAAAVRVLTAIVRSERLSDGSIAGAIDEGTFGAALRCMRRWRDPRS